METKFLPANIAREFHDAEFPSHLFMTIFAFSSPQARKIFPEHICTSAPDTKWIKFLLLTPLVANVIEALYSQNSLL